ncbi:hypothetical protein ACO3VM_09460 (plasmid) [Methanocaldococcus sp. 10A]
MDRVAYYKLCSKYLYYFCLDRMLSCHRLDLDRDRKINWRHPKYWNYNNIPKGSKPYLRHIDLWDNRGYWDSWILGDLRSIYCSPYYFKTPRYELEYPEVDYTYWDWVLDIDFKGDIEKSKEICRAVYDILKDYGVKDIPIKFSGGKGFHIWINARHLTNEILEKGFIEGSKILTQFLEFKLRNYLDFLDKDKTTGIDYTIYKENICITAPFSLYYKDVEGKTPISIPFPINKIEKFKPITLQRIRKELLKKPPKYYENFGEIRGDLTDFIEDALNYYKVTKKDNTNSLITIDIEQRKPMKKPKKEYKKRNEYIKATIGDKEVVLNKSKLENYLKELINSDWTDGKMRACYYLTSLCKLLGYDRDKAKKVLDTWASKYGSKYMKHIEYELKYIYDRNGKVCSIKWIKNNIPEAKNQILIYERYYKERLA